MPVCLRQVSPLTEYEVWRRWVAMARAKSAELWQLVILSAKGRGRYPVGMYLREREGEIPSGYVALGSFLLLQEQIEDTIFQSLIDCQ